MKKIVSADKCGRIKVWSLNNSPGKELIKTLNGNLGCIRSLSIQGDTVISSSIGITDNFYNIAGIWSLSKDSGVNIIDSIRSVNIIDSIRSVTSSLSVNQSRVIYAKKSIELWTLNNKKFIKIAESDDKNLDVITSTAIHGNTIISCDIYNRIKLWSVKGSQIEFLRTISVCPAFVPMMIIQGNLLITVDSMGFRIWF